MHVRKYIYIYIVYLTKSKDLKILIQNLWIAIDYVKFSEAGFIAINFR